MPWRIYVFKYQDYPEYSARITGHYGGDMLLIEEEGELTEKTVSIIKDVLGIGEDVKYFNIEIKDLIKVLTKELPPADKEVLLSSAKKLDAESKIHIEYRYQPNINRKV